MKERTLDRFRVAVILVNLLVATVALANLTALSTRAIEVTVPEDDTGTWSLDLASQRILVQTSFNVKNQALYDIRDINIEALLYLNNETLLLHHTETDMIIPRFSNQNIPITVAIGLKELPLEKLAPLIIMDADISLTVKASATYLWGLGEFDMDQTFYFPWESPLKTAILNYIDDKNMTAFTTMIWDTATTGNMTVFYDALNEADLNAVFGFLGVEISFQDIKVEEDVFGFTITTAYGATEIELRVEIPLFNHRDTTITLSGGVGYA